LRHLFGQINGSHDFREAKLNEIGGKSKAGNHQAALRPATMAIFARDIFES
jgi:hypothetical protein